MGLEKIMSKMYECWTCVCVGGKWVIMNQIIGAIIEKWYEASFCFIYIIMVTPGIY